MAKKREAHDEQEKQEAPGRRYTVRVAPQHPHGSFRRSGRTFGVAPTILAEAEMTEAIRNEPMLIVTEVTEVAASAATDDEKKAADTDTVPA